jgi:hypothetical protein
MSGEKSQHHPSHGLGVEFFPPGYLSVTLSLTRREAPKEGAAQEALTADTSTLFVRQDSLGLGVSSFQSIGATPRIRYGRPDWTAEVRRVSRKLEKVSKKSTEVGVFVCGPTLLCKDIMDSCIENSTSSTTFRFHKEVFS